MDGGTSLEGFGASEPCVDEERDLERIGSRQVAIRRWTAVHAPTRWRVLFCPGQGDFCGRYLEFFLPLLVEGLEVVTFDWPGHGDSGGLRGHVGSLSEARKLLDRLTRYLPGGGLPLGVCGHSMGGLLALDLLGRHPELEFSWVSSPLLQPGYGRPSWLVHGGKLLGRFFPRLTMDTGVRVEDCVPTGETDGPVTRPDEGAWHTRISFGWGAALLHLADEVAGRPAGWSRGKHILCTQGGADEVCPPAFAREYFANLQARVDFRELAGARHEPFAETGHAETIRSALAENLTAWA